MNKLWFLLLIGLMVMPAMINAFTNDLSGRLDFLENATRYAIIPNQYINNVSPRYITGGNSTHDFGLITAWSNPNRINSARKYATQSGFFYSGNASMNLTYNLSATPSVITFVSLNNNIRIFALNVTNYTGIGMWIKGDNSNNYVDLKIISNVTATDTSLQHVEENIHTHFLNYSGWRFKFVDFYKFNNLTSSASSVNYSSLGKSKTQQVMGIALFVRSNSPRTINYSSIYIDNIGFYDFDKGSTNFYRHTRKTNPRPRARLQEGIYTPAYLYINGRAGFRGNLSLLNASLYQGDWLVQQQGAGGNWVDNSLFDDGDDEAILGFTGTAMALTYLELFDNTSRFNDTISLYSCSYNRQNGNDWKCNITQKTRRQHWLNALEKSANYTDDWEFSTFNVATGYFSNQIIGMLTTEYLYYNISRKQRYLIDFNDKIRKLSTSVELSKFGYLPEGNKTIGSSYSIGYDVGYYRLQLGLLSDLYLLSGRQSNVSLLIKNVTKNLNNLVLSDISYIKLFSTNNSRSVYVSRFRGIEEHNRAIANMSNSLNIDSLRKLTFANNVWTTYFTYVSRDTDNELHGGYLQSLDTRYFTSIKDNSYLFPGSLNNLSYDLFFINSSFKQSYNFPRGNFTRTNYTMSNITFAWSNSSVWYINGDFIDRLANGTFTYSGVYSNFTIPIIPVINITESENASFNEADGRVVIRSNRLYFTSSSTSTLKKIASNLSQAINATVRINVAHTNIKDIVFINNNSRDYSPDTWNFVGGQAEMILNNIAPDSNTVYIDYGTQPLGQQQTITGRGILRYITEELPISAFGSKYSLPVWVAGVGIISLGILTLGLFTPISFPIILVLIVINSLLIFTTISRSIS